MTATIQKWGKSQGIRLTRIILEYVNMSEGEEVEIATQDDTIIIRRVTGKRRTIQELFAGYDGDYTPEEIDWGEPVGGEVWLQSVSES